MDAIHQQTPEKDMRGDRQGGASSALPAAPANVIERLSNLLGFSRIEGGGIALSVPHAVPLPQIIESLDTLAKEAGLSTVMLDEDRRKLIALQGRPGVAATPGERYDIDPAAGGLLRSFDEQTRVLAATGSAPAPLTVIALAGMAVRIASLGKENLFNERHIRGAASGLSLWQMNGAVCIEQTPSTPDPTTTMAGMKLPVLTP